MLGSIAVLSRGWVEIMFSHFCDGTVHASGPRCTLGLPIKYALEVFIILEMFVLSCIIQRKAIKSLAEANSKLPR